MAVSGGDNAGMQLARLLFSQGFGSRRECAALCLAGRVRLQGLVHDDPGAEVDTDAFEVDGRIWPVHAKALLMLHKPTGVECSQKPRHHPGVLTLLPLPLRRRGVQPVGRLDADTTGLLLLTDDGALIHRLTSPKHHLPKVYEVVTKHAVDAALLQALRVGVLTDNGHPILDVRGLAITDPLAMEIEINQWPGVVTVGIFARHRARVALLGTSQGVRTLAF